MIPKETLDQLSDRVSEQLHDAKYTIVVMECISYIIRPMCGIGWMAGCL